MKKEMKTIETLTLTLNFTVEDEEIKRLIADINKLTSLSYLPKAFNYFILKIHQHYPECSNVKKSPEILELERALVEISKFYFEQLLTIDDMFDSINEDYESFVKEVLSFRETLSNNFDPKNEKDKHSNIVKRLNSLMDSKIDHDTIAEQLTRRLDNISTRIEFTKVETLSPLIYYIPSDCLWKYETSFLNRNRSFWDFQSALQANSTQDIIKYHFEKFREIITIAKQIEELKARLWVYCNNMVAKLGNELVIKAAVHHIRLKNSHNNPKNPEPNSLWSWELAGECLPAASSSTSKTGSSTVSI